MAPRWPLTARISSTISAPPNPSSTECKVDIVGGREFRVPQPALHLHVLLAVCHEKRPAGVAEGMERDALIVPDGLLLDRAVAPADLDLANLHGDPSLDERRT